MRYVDIIILNVKIDKVLKIFDVIKYYIVDNKY